MMSKNPFFKTKSFENTRNENTYNTTIIDYNDSMTITGTMNKSFILLLLLVSAAYAAWTLTYAGFNPLILAIGGAVVGLILVLISTFKPHLSPYLAPAYALFEGLFIGGISAIFEAMYPGIVINAVAATFVTFLVCLGLYKFNIVKVTEKFKSVVIAATVAIALYYVVTFLLSMFTSFVPVHYGNSWMSIGISVFVIVIAALNLFLDFDRIDEGVQKNMPKYMEWYGAMGLMITLVWLYVEFLRLLSKLNRK
ncbi:MAG: putative YccA/Bax inhibitor family protein [Flavobacterium sp.]|jgi:uncharacterized YccA/Bax inhibitor family protein